MKLSMETVSKKLEGEMGMEFYKREGELIYQFPIGICHMMNISTYLRDTKEWEERGYSQISLQEYLEIIIEKGGDPGLFLENLGLGQEV